MLNRCAATTRCCPKLLEADLSGDGARAHAAQVYSNPYMHDLFDQQGNGKLPLDGDDDGADFPPGAISLMYDPFADDPDDVGEGDHQAPDSSDCARIPVAAPGRSASPPPSHPLKLPPAPMQRVPATTGSLATPRGWGAHGHSPSPSPATVSGSPAEKPSPATVSGSISGRSTASGGTSNGIGGAAGTTGGNNSDSGSPAGDIAGQAIPTSPKSVDSNSRESEVSVQPRTFSRSLRDARSCNSEAGASSIAAIMQCVAQAQDVPVQQRPNSEKWTERWAGMNVDKHVL